MDAEGMEHAVGLLDGLLQEEEFKARMAAFSAENCGIFEDVEENKHEYTTIFQTFQGLVEQHLEERLTAEGVDLMAFLETLPAYMDLPQAHAQTGAIFDMLNAFNDFSAFKEMMLAEKKTLLIDPGAAPAAEAADLPSLPEALQASLELTSILEAGGAEEGWDLVADKGWVQTYKKADPSSPINMTRCFADVKMPAEAMIAIFMDPYKKMEWDNEVQSCEVIGGNGFADDGYVVRQVVKIPLCTARELLWRWQVVHDYPEPGCITGVIYDEPCDAPPADGALRVVCKIGNVVARPTGPDTCKISMFGHMDFHFPAFIWNYTSSNWLVRNVVKLETAYNSVYKGQPPPLP